MQTVTQFQKNLNSMLDSFEPKSGTSQDLYIAICQWLLKNRAVIKDELWNRYGMEKYTSLDPFLYLMEFSEGAIEDNIRYLHDFQTRSIDSLVMKIRDMLWDIVAFKTDIQCTNCGDDAFRALVDPETEELILSCDLCTCSQSLSGEKWNGSTNLVPAKASKLPDLDMS